MDGRGHWEEGELVRILDIEEWAVGAHNLTTFELLALIVH